MGDNKRINIMTSSDQKLARQIPVLVQSMADYLSDKDVHFYLFHSAIESDTIAFLENFCSKKKNVTFHEVVIPNPEDYRQLAGPGGGWSGEAYYSLCAHEFLLELDRVMYVDAGDVLFAGNIDEYYYGDFEGNSLLVTGARFKQIYKYMLLFESDDMGDVEQLKGIVRGLFNSGSYVINLEKMRTDGYTMDDFLFLSSRLAEVLCGEERVYWGDQGLLSAAYVGDMKVFAFPQIASVWYMPYNFCLWYFNASDEKPEYETNVIHYAGACKPWKVKYDSFLECFQNSEETKDINTLKPAQRDYYLMWYKCALRAEETLNMINLV